MYYKDEFEKVFDEQFDFLLDLNTRLLQIIFNILRIEKKTSYTEQFMKFPANMKDCRESSSKKKALPSDHLSAYTQVFSPKHGFISDLSIIDLIFNLGPETGDYLN